ncbi:MAG: PorV/PorQ family protein [Calditrichaeota bacterium]|nr:PorV/PorQ family protein [Calditrichota bacterium]
MARAVSPLVLALLLVTSMANPGRAQFRKVGTAGYTFLEVPVSARVAAMGEVGVALLDAGPEALFVNPALLAHLAGAHALCVSYASYLAETSHQAFSIALRLPRRMGACGLSINRLDLGEMVETVNADVDNPGGAYIVRGTYTADALAIGLSFAQQATAWFAYGLTLRYVRERIAAYTSDNMLVDLGMVYTTGFRSFRLGGYVQNFGVDSRYIGDSFKMPMVFRLGAAMELLGALSSPYRLTLAADALHPSDYNERLHVGAECWLANVVALRLGYKFYYDEDGLTLGCGFKKRTGRGLVAFDLAHTDYGRLQSVLRMSFSAEF